MPKNISFLRVLLRTKKYCGSSEISSICENKEKEFYVFLRKKYLQIEFADLSPNTLRGIQEYLDYVFSQKYIGMHKKNAELLHLKKAKVVILT